LAYLEVRAPDALGKAGLFLTHASDATIDDSITQRLRNELGLVLVATNHDVDVPHQCLAHFGGTFLYAPLNAFLQINSAVNQLLVEQVVLSALQSGCDTFADLFGGAGNFALALVQAGLSGMLAEYNADAVRAAQRSARQQNLSGLVCQHGDAIAAARQHLANAGAFDIVIVDPPRAGIREGLEGAAALAKRAILYCSCNLQTLTRDLGVLHAAGWSLHRLSGFDMFPGTRHVEALAWLVPKNPRSHA